MLKFLVTGTGRCGTVFMAKTLTALGVPCGHETIFDWHGLEMAQRRLMGEEPLELSLCSRVTWIGTSVFVSLPEWLSDVTQIQADSSYMAAPFLGEDCLAGARVIHVVRNPLLVVNSFCNYLGYFQSETPSNRYEEFIYTHVPTLARRMTQYDRACMFYLRWNEMIPNSALVYRVEDNPLELKQALGLTGEVITDRTINSMKKRATSTKRFTLRDITDQSILEEFVEAGRRYGYSMRSEL